MLIKETESAVDRGAFGAPTIFVHKSGGAPAGEMYFGSDRFHLIFPEVGFSSYFLTFNSPVT